MSFIRHKKIYRHDVQGEAEHRSSFPSDHRCDESSAGYSFVGCSPAAPTSASPAVPSFSLYSAAVQFSAANRNCPSIALSQPRGPLQTKRTPIETKTAKFPMKSTLSNVHPGRTSQQGRFLCAGSSPCRRSAVYFIGVRFVPSPSRRAWET